MVTAEPEDFAPNELLTSVKLNANFQGPHDRLTAVEGARVVSASVERTGVVPAGTQVCDHDSRPYDHTHT